MNRAHVRQRPKNPAGGGVGGFQPSTLFGTGEQGLWFDPSDMSTMFQDSAGTTPVTAADQVVGLIRDKSGNGNHAIQATAANKPILRNTGALWWLEFDGTDDFLVTGNMSLVGIDKVTMFAGVRKASDAATALIAEHGPAAGTNPSFSLFGPSGGGANKFDFRIRGTSTAIASTTSATFNAPITAVLTGQGDLAAPLTTLRINGAQVASVATATGGGTFGNQPIFIGRTAGTSAPFTGNIYGLIIRGAQSNSLTVAGGESYMGSKTGIPL